MFSTSASSTSFSTVYNSVKNDFLWNCALNDIQKVMETYKYLAKEDLLSGLRTSVTSKSINVFNFLFNEITDIPNSDIHFIYANAVNDYNTKILKTLLDNIHKHENNIDYATLLLLYSIQVKEYSLSETKRNKKLEIINFLLDYNIVLKNVLYRIEASKHYPPILRSILKKKLNCKTNTELNAYLNII